MDTVETETIRHRGERHSFSVYVKTASAFRFIAPPVPGAEIADALRLLVRRNDPEVKPYSLDIVR